MEFYLDKVENEEDIDVVRDIEKLVDCIIRLQIIVL